MVPPPSLVSVMPVQVCTAQGDTPVRLDGVDFLQANGTPPTATFTNTMDPNDTFSVVAEAVDPQLIPMGCRRLATTTSVLVQCDFLIARIPMGRVTVGTTYEVRVINPRADEYGMVSAGGCRSVEPGITIIGTPPPVLTDVMPKTLCFGGGKLTLTGMNFAQGASVTLGPLTTNSVAVDMAGTTAVATFGAGLPVGGPYDVTLSNGDGCSSTLPAQVSVSVGPTIFFADPPTVWNGIGTQITVYGANIQPPIRGVSIQLSGTSNAPIVLTFSTSPQSPNRATALVPRGTPAGTYDILVGDQSACPAILVGGLKVVAQTSFTISAITPAYGWNGENTAITITSQGAFQATPRAYLSLSGGGGNDATVLTAVAFVDANELNAVVPKTNPPLTPGRYDLIVVNPDGTVGVLQGGFTIIPNPTPLVTSVQPGSVPASQPTPFTVFGRNFAPNARVTLQCRDQNGAPMTAPMLSPGAPYTCGNEQCINVPGVTWPGAGFCVVTVTNPTDGSTFDFSSLVITNAGQKLGDFMPTGQAMRTARRALGLVTGQATPSHRYVYAIGGDAGAEASALDTVEATQITVFGQMKGWAPQRYRLTKARTFVGAVTVGRFIYVVGGSDGAGAITTVERATILDPTKVPIFTDLDIGLPAPGQQGLAGGYYYYRVAAVMGPNDPFNPGGEDLSSDPFVLLSPRLRDGAWLTLTWTAVPGAAHYRIYRSPRPDLGSGSEVLVADNVVGTSWQDQGATPILFNGQPLAPLRIGSTGAWTTLTVPALATPRSGAAVTTAPDPNDPTVRYLYALGGNRTTAGAPMPVASTELLRIKVNPDGSQTLGAMWAAGPNLGVAKWQAGGYSAVLPNNAAYLWAGAGLGVGGVPLSDVQGATVTPGTGVPTAWQAVSGVSPARAGSASVAINEFLYAFGGGAAVPDPSAKQVQLANNPPALQNWTNSTFLTTPRYLTAGVVASGFIFVCGGAGAGAGTSCETTIW